MDRWLEIDFDWFGPPPNSHRVEQFIQRVAPLWVSADGDRGVILNVGWLVDIVTEWTGNSHQKLPLRSRRYQRWRDADYFDLRGIVQELKAVAQSHGVADLRVGVLIAGLGQVVSPRDTGAMYDLYSNWYDRHPELYPLDISDLPGPDLDPRVPLQADGYAYATRPDGVQQGVRFADLLAEQWGSLAEFAGLDAVHLRDGFFGPLLYSRRGPYGTTASADPEVNATWTDEMIHLIRRIKDVSPASIVMAYSSGISRTAEWRVGCVDLYRVVAESGLDVWIDQTWGGAWQDWWDDWWKGWTYQFANLLGHGVSLRRANRSRPEDPCKHFKLIETWDGWEPWDTIHRTPGKLMWGIWAFSHAAVITSDGLRVPEGSYISWMNDWDLQLLSDADIGFLGNTLDRAERSGGRLQEALGPIAVFDDATVERVHRTAPQQNASEWLEDHLAMLLKWGTPILAACDRDDIPIEVPEGLVWQVSDRMSRSPGQSPDGGAGPSIAAGRADWIDERHLARCGVRDLGVRLPAGYRRDEAADKDLPRGDSVHLPDHQQVSVADTTAVRYAAKGNPLLAGRDGYWYWQPPDLVDPGNPLMPRSQLGTIAPYVAVARVLEEESAGIRTRTVPVEFPVTVQAWRSDDGVHILAGNLESGWIGDSRTPRTVELTLPRARIGLPCGTVEATIESSSGSASVDVADDSETIDIRIDVPPSGCAIVHIRTALGAS
jgi:hypothetical protein